MRLSPSSDPELAARLTAVSPSDYALTRNHLDGAVTGLSPWITHGSVTLPELVEHFQLQPDDKLAFQFGWREFFHHVWRQLGEGIFADIRPGLPGVTYAGTLPADIREARSGIPTIDRSVAELYATGYLHNHARLWLASYTVHLRKVHWRVAADWFYGHLRDGDLAANHLSWQWVAATFSSKPYLFNADNVARFAPADWHCPGSVLDTRYERLEEIARHSAALDASPPTGDGVLEPPLHGEPPLHLVSPADFLSPDSSGPLHLVHPWALRPVPAGSGRRIGVIHLPFHQRFPWSAERWAFVLPRLRAVTDALFIGDIATLNGHVSAEATLNPGYRDALAAIGAELTPAPRWLPDPPELCPSFSRFWQQTAGRRHAGRWHA